MKNLTIQSTPVQTTKQQHPSGYLGFKYPLILGLGIGILIGSLRNKHNLDSNSAICYKFNNDIGKK